MSSEIQGSPKQSPSWTAADTLHGLMRDYVEQLGVPNVPVASRLLAIKESAVMTFLRKIVGNSNGTTYEPYHRDRFKALTFVADFATALGVQPKLELVKHEGHPEVELLGCARVNVSCILGEVRQRVIIEELGYGGSLTQVLEVEARTRDLAEIMHKKPYNLGVILDWLLVAPESAGREVHPDHYQALDRMVTIAQASGYSLELSFR